MNHLQSVRPLFKRHTRIRSVERAIPQLRIEQSYCFSLLTDFAPLSLGLSSVKASSALNGNWRTDCCPVLPRVMSTRRFWARVTTCNLLRILSLWSVWLKPGDGLGGT